MTIEQRDEAWVAKATPEQIVAAEKAGELTVYAGGQVDDEGHPVDKSGRRIEMGRGR